MDGLAAAKILAELITINPNDRKRKTLTEKCSTRKFRTEVVWFNAIGFLVLHICGLYGFFWGLYRTCHGDYLTFLWNFSLGILAGQGVTMGAHRLWSHKSFKAKLPLEIILIILQTLSSQNCLYIWARDHRQHHKYSDTDGDPHNSNRGFFFSHIGWLMMRKHPDVILKGKNIDMTDLEANPIVMFQKKYYKRLYFIIAWAIPIGVPVYFWNEDFQYSLFVHLFRVIAILNATWCVNSVAHFFGYRPYNRHIRPVESAFTSFITSGEGWHNYHHSFPWDYKASELGSPFNITRVLIEAASKIGWAYDLKIASEDVVSSKSKKMGDLSPFKVYENEIIKNEENAKARESYSLRSPSELLNLGGDWREQLRSG